MPTVKIERRVDDDELAELLTPQQSMVAERVLGDGDFGLDHGPFDHWHRRIVVTARHDDGTTTVNERVDFELALGMWRYLFSPLVKRAIRTHPGHDASLWWSPPDTLDSRAARVLGILCVFSIFTGYLGVLLSQTNTYFKTEFAASNADISWVLTGVRAGALGALVFVAIADRRGRRKVLLVATYAGIALAVTGAIAPGVGFLGVSQTLARSCSAAIALLIGIMSVEEMPAGSRAFAVSVLAMSGAVGAGGVVLFLQVAEFAPWAWRLFYLVPLGMIVPVVWMSRMLPETRRFEVYEAEEAGLEAAPAAPEAGSGTGTTGMSHRRRFALLGSTALLFAVFFTPATNFLNEYLRTEQGFNGLKISMLQVFTNLPGGVAIVVGGRLADTYGRRLIGALGVAGGVGFTVAMFNVTGWPIWVFSTLATLCGAMSVPALGVYGPELFPTSSRGMANGGLNILGVIGSVVGLLAAGSLADRWGSLAPAMVVLGIGPVLVVAIIVLGYPETAYRELEELNPEDARPPSTLAGIAALEHELVVHGVDPDAERLGVGVPDDDAVEGGRASTGEPVTGGGANPSPPS